MGFLRILPQKPWREETHTHFSQKIFRAALSRLNLLLEEKLKTYLLLVHRVAIGFSHYFVVRHETLICRLKPR
jgi:hypothetical protein